MSQAARGRNGGRRGGTETKGFFTRMANKTEVFHVRLTQAEAALFKERSAAIAETRSRVLRKCVREWINQEPDFLQSELMVLALALRQLAGMANNLNQITHAMHAGLAGNALNDHCLEQTSAAVHEFKRALMAYIKRTRQRWTGSEGQWT